jgi:hypothetical protein
VFHSPQSGHLPTHFGESAPQLEQTYTVFVFAISLNLSVKIQFLISHDYLSIQLPLNFNSLPILYTWPQTNIQIDNQSFTTQKQSYINKQFNHKKIFISLTDSRIQKTDNK